MISEERIKEILTPVFMRQDQASIHWPDIFEEVRAIEAEVAAPLEAELDLLMKDNERLLSELRHAKSIPMKYRRMEFNAQLQEENKQQAERIKQLEQVNSSKLDEAKRAWGTANRLIEQAREQIVWMLGDHIAPNDCYSTGPLTGTLIDNLCPSCYAHKLLAAIEQYQKGDSHV